MIRDLYNNIVDSLKKWKNPPSRMLTICIPLDHQDFTDEDQQKLNELGSELRLLLKPYRGMHAATSHAIGKIGLVIAGDNINDDTRKAIIANLKQQRPLGTYFTVEEIYDHKDEIDTFDIPLFEEGEVAICEKF